MLAKLATVGVFIVAVGAANYAFHYLWRGFAVHHADSPAVQGAASVLN